MVRRVMSNPGHRYPRKKREEVKENLVVLINECLRSNEVGPAARGSRSSWRHLYLDGDDIPLITLTGGPTASDGTR